MFRAFMLKLGAASLAAVVLLVYPAGDARSQSRLDLRPRLRALETRNFQLRLELYRLDTLRRQQLQRQNAQFRQQLQRQNSQFRQQLQRLESLGQQPQWPSWRQQNPEALPTPGAPRPKDAKGWLQRGQTNLARQDYGAALLAFNQAIVLDPTDANTYLNRGLALFELGDVVGAASNFDQAIRYNPRLAQAYRYRGAVRFQLGEQAGAVQDLQIAAGLFANQGDQASAAAVQQLIQLLQR